MSVESVTRKGFEAMQKEVVDTEDESVLCILTASITAKGIASVDVVFVNSENRFTAEEGDTQRRAIGLGVVKVLESTFFPKKSNSASTS